MTAGYVIENPEDVSEGKYRAINRMLYTRDLPARYDFVLVDSVKVVVFDERSEIKDYHIGKLDMECQIVHAMPMEELMSCLEANPIFVEITQDTGGTII